MGSKGTPLVTVGMPTFNRVWSLPRILESMRALDYDKKRLRICFVDSCSTDTTVDIIESFKRDYGKDYESVVLRVERSNISQARNIAFREAAGTDYIFFLDSDILCPPDTLKRLLASFERDPSVGIASLPWDNRNSKRRAGFLHDAFVTPAGPHYAYKVGNGCNVVSMAAFSRVGFFNEKLRVHEDGEYCYRLRREGFKIVCDYSSEGTHLREYKLTPGYYFSFMRDSSEAYLQLLSRGSPLHIAKVSSSLAMIVCLVALLARPGVELGLVFVALVTFAVWLNSDKMALDDGSRVRGIYRPVVGGVFTAATTVISVMLILAPLMRRRTS